MFFIGLLKWVGGSFPHIVVRWISEDDSTRWFLNTLFLEEKNRIICPNFFYIYRCNVVAFYKIYFFSLVARRYLYGGKICLGVGGKVVQAEGGWLCFHKYISDDVSYGTLKVVQFLQWFQLSQCESYLNSLLKNSLTQHCLMGYIYFGLDFSLAHTTHTRKRYQCQIQLHCATLFGMWLLKVLNVI